MEYLIFSEYWECYNRTSIDEVYINIEGMKPQLFFYDNNRLTIKNYTKRQNMMTRSHFILKVKEIHHLFIRVNYIIMLINH